jgi:hypothetical protein
MAEDPPNLGVVTGKRAGNVVFDVACAIRGEFACVAVIPVAASTSIAVSMVGKVARVAASGGNTSGVDTTVTGDEH